MLAVLALAGCTSSPPARPTPPPVASPTPSPARPVAQAPDVRSWRLPAPPPGYVPPADPGSYPEVRTVQYLPTAGANAFGRRISVVASSDSPDELVGAYEDVQRLTVRGGLPARYVDVGGAGSRHGLAWQQSPGTTVVVWGYADLAELRRYAEQAEPCPATGC